MARRRAIGEGSRVYETKDGRKRAAITVNGKQVYFSGKTSQEVRKKRDAALKALAEGLPTGSERLTLGAFLNDWLETIKPTLKPSTWKRYEQYVRLHTVPTLGRVKLSRLEPVHLARLYAERLDVGLSPTTVKHLHTAIHTALELAVRWNRVARNVADLVDAPKAPRHEMQTLSQEEAKTFVGAAREDRLEALYVLAITTGMREGELLGLKWEDMNFEHGKISVQRSLQQDLILSEPKTSQSRRLVTLTDDAIEALTRHQRRQLEERLKMGPVWKNGGLVFTNLVGRPIQATNLLKRC